MRGGLASLVALALVLALAGGWFFWGRGAWRGRQAKELMAQAVTAYNAARYDEADALCRRAAEIPGLPTSVAKELAILHKAVRIRQAYEEQLRRERVQIVIRGSWTPFRDLRNDFRRYQLPCPAFIEFLGELGERNP